MTDQLEMELTGGVLSLAVHQNYSPWGAISEWVDNSVQSYSNHRKDLQKLGSKKLSVSIHYEPNKILRIRDDAAGMDIADLKKAFAIGSDKERKTDDLGQNNAGLKVACMWMGKDWTIKTKRFDSDEEITVKANTEALISGNFKLNTKIKTVNDNSHYTIIEITNHWKKRNWRQGTIAKTKRYLASTYRFFLEEDLEISWTSAKKDEILQFQDLITAKRISDGSEFRWDIKIGFKNQETNKTEPIVGFIGLLEPKGNLKGQPDAQRASGRINAGFSVFRRNRMIQGYPESWKPEEIFGEASGGSNDRVNQRVYGVLHFDNAAVDQQKSQISHEDLSLLSDYLYKKYVELDIKKESDGLIESTSPATPDQIDTATQNVKEKLENSDADIRIRDEVAPRDVVEMENEAATSQLKNKEPSTIVNIGIYTIKLYTTDDLVSQQPYLISEAGMEQNTLNVTINMNHPYLTNNIENLQQYITDCIFEAISYWKARELNRDEGLTVSKIKDNIMRLEKN